MNAISKSILTIRQLLGLTLLGMACSTTALASEEAKHIPGIFIGILDTDDENETSLGVEYEYKFTTTWGAGLVYEKAKDAHHHDGVTSTIALVYYHPHAGWRLGAGVGKEKVGGDHSHTEDLVRLGVAYDFHVGGIGIAPTFNIDRVDGENAKVYGVAFSKAF